MLATAHACNQASHSKVPVSGASASGPVPAPVQDGVHRLRAVPALLAEDALRMVPARAAASFPVGDLRRATRSLKQRYSTMNTVLPQACRNCSHPEQASQTCGATIWV